MAECVRMDPRCERLFEDIREELQCIRRKLDELRSANGLAGKVVRLEERAAMSGRRWGVIAGIAAGLITNILTWMVTYYFLARAMADMAAGR